MTDLTEVKTILYISILLYILGVSCSFRIFFLHITQTQKKPPLPARTAATTTTSPIQAPFKKNSKGKRYNMSSTDAPAGDVQDNSYVNRPGQNEYNVPVVKDDTAAAAATEEGGYTDESTADSDAQLGIFISLSLSPLLPLYFSFTHKLTNSPTLFHLFFSLSHPSLTHSHPSPPNSKRRSRHRQNQHSRIENSWSSKGSRILYRAGR